MGGLTLQKRLAASLLKVGSSRVWLDADHLEDIKNSITRSDIKKMISHGYIATRPGKLKYPIKRDGGRKKNAGSRKGKKGARYKSKRIWINTVRPLRKMLKDLKDKKTIDNATYKKTYMLIKGGSFRSRAHLKLYLSQRGIKV